MDPSVFLAIHEEDYPQLREAFAAFRARDWRKLIGLCIYAAGVDRPHAETRGDVHSWGFACGSALLVIALDMREGTIAIDAPLVDVRPETEVALLRAALTGPTGPARAARRGDRLILTKVHRMEAMPPPRLVAAIRDIAQTADALDNLFAFEFGVRLIGPSMRRGLLFDLTAAGTPRRLTNLDAATRPVSLQPASRTRRASASAQASIGTANVARFLDVVREGAEILLSLGFSQASSTHEERVLHLSLALRAAHAGGLELDGSRLLLQAALDLERGRTEVGAVRPLYNRLLRDRGLCGDVAAVAWPAISPEAVKPTLAKRVAAASTLSLTAHRRSALLGGVCELILFGTLPPHTVEKLRALHDASLGTDTAAVDTLRATLEKIST